MRAEENENAASARIAAFPNINTGQSSALAWRRILKVCHTRGPDAELYNAHRIKMMQAGWPL